MDGGRLRNVGNAPRTFFFFFLLLLGLLSILYLSLYGVDHECIYVCYVYAAGTRFYFNMV